MTSNDTLLPCPFCGGDARLHDNKQELCVLCYGCEMEVFGNTADECVSAWNRRTPPTPATDEREAVARAICYADGTENCHCKGSCQDDDRPRVFYEYADAALSALAQIRAAEILAAEANERALRHALAVAAQWFSGYADDHRAKGTPDANTKAERNAERARYCLAAAERNEHGAGK